MTLNLCKNNMFYTYILLSKKDKKMYTGYTKDLKSRFEQHKQGRVESTKLRRPLELVYYEACNNKQDAAHRERYLKTHYGKKYIKSRLKSYLTG
ncbi:GIY-YIG nuclease family protein [candidate division KSB1 bacterium]